MGDEGWICERDDRNNFNGVHSCNHDDSSSNQMENHIGKKIEKSRDSKMKSSTLKQLSSKTRVISTTAQILRRSEEKAKQS